MQRLKAKSFIFTLVVVFLSGCATLTKHKVHHAVLDNNAYQFPKKVLLLPLDVAVYELTAMGQREEVGAWTESAKKHINESIMSGNHKMSNIQFVSMPRLTDREQDAVDQHLSLFDILARNVIYYTGYTGGRGPWSHKSRKFDYTIGPGLKFLRNKTGINTAFVVFGEDTVSSGGRVATFVVLSLFGVAIPMGHSVLIGGLIDLNTGDVLWMDYNFDGLTTNSLREKSGVQTLMQSLLKNYPGIESYRAALN